MEHNEKLKGLHFPVQPFILMLTIAAVFVASAFHYVIANTKSITVHDDGKVVCFKTMTSTVAEAFAEQGIKIMTEDNVWPLPNTKLEREQEIKIKRAVPVTVLVDDGNFALWSSKETVEEVLQQADIALNPDDIINYDLSDSVLPNMLIEVTRIEKTIDTELEKIDFQVIKRPNERMGQGETRIVQYGEEGLRKKQYAIVMHNGKEFSKELVSDEVLKQPVPRIDEYGTVAVYKTSRGDSFRYKKVLNMRATAYDLSYESCGKNPDHPQYGITATGMKARYGVVAVDPKTIPLHSRLYIEATDGSWTYGFAVAGDTGGLVKGDIIDLFYDDTEFVNKFGIRKAKVYVLE